MHLVSMYRDIVWRADTESHLATSDIDDVNFDVAADDDAFIHFSRQYEHDRFLSREV